MNIELIITIIGIALLVGGYFLVKSNLLKNKGLEAIWIGIQDTYDTYVSVIKKGREDGTLSQEEVQEAKKKAIEKALLVAKGPVKDLLLSWGQDKVNAIITSIVQKNKDKDNMNNIK